MTIDEFTKEIEEMENFYNQKEKMTDSQKKIWFQNLKTMDIKRLKYIISQLYKSSKFLPKLADIVEISNNIGYMPKNNTKNKIKCSKCKNIGYIIYKKIIKNGSKKMEYEFMAVCECGIQKQYKGWEIEDERNKSNYYMPLAKEIGL